MCKALHRTVFAFLILSLAVTHAAFGVGATPRQLAVAEFPGFTIKLPGWNVVETAGGPSAGTHRRELGPVTEIPVAGDPTKRRRVAEGTLVVHWRGGAMNAAEQSDMRRMLVESTSSATGIKFMPNTLENGRWVDVGTIPGGAMAIGGVYCEPGLAIQIVLGVRSNSTAELKQLGSDIVRSVQCRAGSAPILPPALAIKLPAGFGITESREPTMYYSLDGSAIVVNSTSGNVMRNTASLDTILKSMLGAMGEVAFDSVKSKTAAIKRTDNLPSAFTVVNASIDQQPAEMYIGSLYCEQIGATYMMIMMGDAMSAAMANTIATSMGCPGAEQTKVPTVSAVFGQACNRGEAAACMQLSELVEQGDAKADHGTAAELKQKACKLGPQEFCE